MSDDLGADLWHSELAFLHVCEEVSSAQILHHDVYVVFILEDIEESNDIGVLTHFENFNFTSL